MSKRVEILSYEKVLCKLIYLINNLEEIKNATWLNNASITNTKDTSLVMNQSTICVFTIFLWRRIIIVGLVLQQICITVPVDLVI